MRKLFPVLCITLLAGSGSTVMAQMRFESSLSFSLGGYAADGLGTNLFYGGKYDYFFLGGRYFVEASLGVSSLKSRVVENISKSQLFPNDKLVTYEFLFAYDGVPAGAFPFIVAGVAGVNQGGSTVFAGVLGLGKRITLPGSNQLGFRYDIRDMIYTQTISNSDPFITHNFVFSIGLQIYF